MFGYEETMRRGAAEYADVIAALRAIGFSVEFVQTGGMNAAIILRLDEGGVLLLADKDDALSWARSEKQGWSVGLYADESLEGGAEVSMADARDDLQTLVYLIDEVLTVASRGR